MNEIAIDIEETIKRRRIVTVKACHVDEIDDFIDDLMESGSNSIEEWERQIGESYEIVETVCYEDEIDFVECTDIFDKE